MNLKFGLMSKIKDIKKFILQRKYFLKVTGVKKSLWRKELAKRFMESNEYKSKKWTSDDFAAAWDELSRLNMI